MCGQEGLWCKAASRLETRQRPIWFAFSSMSTASRPKWWPLIDQQDSEVLGESAVKVSYDPRTDTLTPILKEDSPVAESDEDKPGVILDYDAQGNLVSMEILDASRRVTEAQKVEFQIAR